MIRISHGYVALPQADRNRSSKRTGLLRLGSFLGHQRKYQEALVAIDQAIRLEPNEQQYQKVKEMLEANAKSR